MTLSKIVKALSFIHFPIALVGQSLDFYGLFPIASYTQIITSKVEINFLAASKISSFDRIIEGIKYPAHNLEFYVQGQVAYKLTEKLSCGGTYGFQRNNPFENNYTNEHRFAQQLMLGLTAKRGSIYQRIRFEERFIESAQHDSYRPGTRLRYLIGYMLPLKNSSYYFNASNEVFMITGGASFHFFAEDMAYLGLGRKSELGSRIEIGLVYNPSVRNQALDLRNLFLLQVLWSGLSHQESEKIGHSLMHMRHY